MDLTPYLPPAAMAAAALGGVAAMAFNLRRARTIEDTPTAKIRSAAQGYVSLGGFARAGDDGDVVAPLTRTPCVWYRYRIERYERGSKSSHWSTVESGSSEQLFTLDDTTGRCHIDPRRAEVSTTLCKRWHGNERHPGRPAAGVLGTLFGQRYRYTEYRIHADEWLYVLGWFETVHAPGPQQQAQVHMKNLLNEWKRDREALLARFDSNGDGEIDVQEWERARAEAARQAQHYVLQQPQAEPVNTVARPPLNDRPYLISTRDPQQLARRYRRGALLSLVAGLGIAVAVGWYLLHPH